MILEGISVDCFQYHVIAVVGSGCSRMVCPLLAKPDQMRNKTPRRCLPLEQ